MRRDLLASGGLVLNARVASLLRIIASAFPLFALLIVALAVGSQLAVLPYAAQIAPALSGMAMLTALGLVSISIVQFGMRRDSLPGLKAGSIAGLVFSIIALLSYAFAGADVVSSRIADWLFGATPLSANRCSIATFLSMMLLSFSQLCRLNNRTLACDYLAGVCILIAGAALIATLFGVPDLHHIFIYSSMSVPTALSVWLLGIASIATDPSKGWAALIASGRPAGRTTRQQILFSHVPILLVGLAIYGIRIGRMSTEAAMTFLVVLVMAPTVLLIFKSARAQESRDKTNEAVERFRLETTSGVQTQLLAQATALRKESEERLKAESTMYRAQRLEAIGQLTGGIAHDFNNLLMAVNTTLNLVVKQLLPAHPARLLVERAMAITDRGAHLTKQLLVFSKTQMIDVRSTELNAVIDRARELIGSALGPNIQILTDIRTEDVWVKTDPDQLQLAILNLALNARDAMPEGGELRISTTANATEIIAGQAHQAVRIRVADTGVGMSPDVAARAVEPFFTTKAQGEGTGLGLAQVYGVMKQSGGDLRIETEPGMGTAIDLLLIRTEPVLIGDFAINRPLRSSSEAKCAVVLLIDDDDEVRTAMAELFRCDGHEVIEASTGQAGLDELERSNPSVAVIDYLMPGLNGVQVAQKARERLPTLPIVFVSGYSDTLALEAIEGARVLRKPVNADELLAVVGAYS